MKKKSMLVAGLALCLFATMSVGLASCGDDEPTPTIIDNPLDAEAYYIIGKVSQGASALEGVKVSASGVEAKTAADGTFQLEVGKKGDYSVAFAKEGYIAVTADVTIAANADKRSSVAVVQELTKVNPPVSVKPDQAISVSGGSASGGTTSVTTLEIPAGAVKKATEITITEYVEGAKQISSHAGLSTINCQPDGLKFEKPVKVEVKNMTSNMIYFEDVTHYVQKNGIWEKVGTTTYDAASNTYAAELTGFSNHSFVVSYATADKGTTTETMGDVQIDNLGKMEVKEGDVSGKQKMGWTIDGDLNALLKAQFPALSAADVDGLASTINGAIASTKGSTAGVSESTVSMGTAKVSGDTKMTVTFVASVTQTIGTFHFVYQGKAANMGVPVKTYNGVNTQITYQYGNSRPDHSGGTGH